MVCWLHSSPFLNGILVVRTQATYENMRDIRRTRVIGIHQGLWSYNAKWRAATAKPTTPGWGIELLPEPQTAGPFAEVAFGVKHRQLIRTSPMAALQALGNGRAPIVVDVSRFFNRATSDAGWQL